MIHVHF
jgi:ribosomal protein L7Ae-like RNA K-turn-binding protein